MKRTSELASVFSAAVRTAEGEQTVGALAQASKAPDVREEKVESLRAAIASGTYNVSSSDVADKLIGKMRAASKVGNLRLC